MADTKVSALTADTSVDSADLGYTIEDPAGTPVSKKATWLNILKGAALGVLTSDEDIFVRAAGALTRLNVPASTFLGRKASGSIAAMTGAEAQALLTAYATSTLGGTAASFDFASIPATARHLRLVCQLRTDRAGQTSDGVNIAFNNDTTATNYEWQRIQGTGTTASSLYTNDAGNIARCPGATATASQFGIVIIDIPMYAGTTANKNAQATVTSPDTAGSVINTAVYSTCWQSTAAINRVTLTPVNGPNFIAGSSVDVYLLY